MVHLYLYLVIGDFFVLILILGLYVLNYVLCLNLDKVCVMFGNFFIIDIYIVLLVFKYFIC